MGRVRDGGCTIVIAKKLARATHTHVQSRPVARIWGKPELILSNVVNPHVCLKQLQAVAAVEPELRELLCVLLDADLSFDLSSSKYPHLVGGAVAATLQEVMRRFPSSYWYS